MGKQHVRIKARGKTYLKGTDTKIREICIQKKRTCLRSTHLNYACESHVMFVSILQGFSGMYDTHLCLFPTEAQKSLTLIHNIHVRFTHVALICTREIIALHLYIVL